MTLSREDVQKELRAQLVAGVDIRDTTRDLRPNPAWVMELIRRTQDIYATKTTYAELREAAMDMKRIRAEWEQGTEDAWMVNLDRILGVK